MPRSLPISSRLATSPEEDEPVSGDFDLTGTTLTGTTLTGTTLSVARSFATW
jgi:hypothetical protein